MPSVPPPIESPQVPRDDEGGPDPFARHDTKEMPVTKGAMLNANRFTRILMLGISLCVGAPTGLGAGWYAVRSMRAEAQEAAKIITDAGTEKVRAMEQRVVLLEQAQVQQRQDTHETQADIREPYGVVQTGRTSARLEAPPITPAVADGGK